MSVGDGVTVWGERGAFFGVGPASGLSLLLLRPFFPLFFLSSFVRVSDPISPFNGCLLTDDFFFFFFFFLFFLEAPSSFPFPGAVRELRRVEGIHGGKSQRVRAGTEAEYQEYFRCVSNLVLLLVPVVFTAICLCRVVAACLPCWEKQFCRERGSGGRDFLGC